MNVIGDSRDFWQKAQFNRFILFSWLLLPGIVMFLIAMLGPVDWPYGLVGLAGAWMMLPFMIHLNILAIQHRKDRYIGEHRQLWGVLVILLAFTCWGNLIYLFKHVLPDRMNRGRYQRISREVSSQHSGLAP